MKRDALVGAVFVAAVALFAVFALYAGGLEGVGKELQPLYTSFPNVAGLEVQDRVSLAGVEAGEVRRIFVEGGEVKVEMMVYTNQPIKADSVATLESEGIMGGRRIDISLGSVDSPGVGPGGSIPGRAEPGIEQLVESVSAMSGDVQNLVTSLQSNQETFFADLGEVVSEAKTTFTSVNRILGDNEEKLSEAMGSLADAGPRIEAMVTRLDDITKQVQSGEGTLGKLVYDSALYDEMLALGQSLNQSAERLSGILDDHGEDIGAAMEAFADAAPQFQETMASINRITKRLEEGEGTLGKLLTDEQLYVEATRAMQAVGDAAENAREQGPISTFTGAVVGAATALN